MSNKKEIEKLTEELAKARHYGRGALAAMISIQIERLKSKEED
jgi:hypothetical protein